MSQRTGVGHNPRHALGRLLLLQRRKLLHARPRPDPPVQVLPDFSESWTIPDKAQDSIPPNDFATHREYGSVGIVSRSFIEEVDGGFR